MTALPSGSVEGDEEGVVTLAGAMGGSDAVLEMSSGYPRRRSLDSYPARTVFWPGHHKASMASESVVADRLANQLACAGYQAA